ncbi:50S ribosomal protein L30 [Geobacter benzoatilyticus]|jgi:large subunit ribosomal protein L30|uniref:50S ribosomal protein L30 n=1 Tax=Geobacter benzoatilyticus TaxID=2815309 RepID=A0ABX7PYS0_9BACT|nr:50S ribosomal protein L30 [Geobacter benzoatilyticus]MDA8226115.1 50S ribosomal protein L30 [Desulfitobacterium hafniense]QSV44291.1 50S ribosomal protein L30 [Geobacter benzoatilyticus]
MSAELKITLIRSQIGVKTSQRAVLNGMGLTKLNKTVVLKNTPEIVGMIAKVSHMVKVEE